VDQEGRRERNHRWSGLNLDKHWAGEDFDARFPDDLTDPNDPKEYDFQRFIAERLLRHGLTCPKCSRTFTEVRSWVAGRAAFRCPGCGKQLSLFAGTVFKGTQSLREWFEACWIMVARPDGLSTLDLSKALGINEKTTLSMVHSVQEVWALKNLDKLETKTGGGSGSSRETEEWIESCWIEKEICGGHILVLLRFEKGSGKTRRGKIIKASYGQSRIRLVFIPNDCSPLFSNKKLAPQLILYGFAKKNSLIRLAEGWSPGALEVLGLKSQTIQTDEFSSKSVAMTFVDRLQKIYHNKITHKFLKLYIEEFVYRFNTMRGIDRHLLFDALLEGLIRLRSPQPAVPPPGGTTQSSSPAKVG